VVRYGRGEVEVEVTNDGSGAAVNGSAGAGGGHGLIGMRERVALYGGKLEVGQRREGGFAVHAQLPAGGVLA
jgi:signal transduction histidine kinase